MLFWVAGVVVVVVFLSGVCLDLWRAVAAQRALAAAVDAAAAAGANGIDEEAWREREELRLDPARAEALAAEVLAAQPVADTYAADIAASAESIVIDAERVVTLTLLRMFGRTELTVAATSTATPRRSP